MNGEVRCYYPDTKVIASSRGRFATRFHRSPAAAGGADGLSTPFAGPSGSVLPASKLKPGCSSPGTACVRSQVLG
jgi:hypothetical protein